VKWETYFGNADVLLAAVILAHFVTMPCGMVDTAVNFEGAVRGPIQSFIADTLAARSAHRKAVNGTNPLTAFFVSALAERKPSP
jgi:hypothetical protein